MDLPNVKISGQYYRNFKISVDGTVLKKVTDVKIDFDLPTKVTVTMLANVDIDTYAGVDCKQIVYKNGKVYELKELKKQ